MNVIVFSATYVSLIALLLLLRGAKRRSNLMKNNEIAIPQPLQFLMVGTRNDK
jgi:hypothetical protein